MATTPQILKFIAAKPATFGEIQRHICELNGLDYDEREQSIWKRAPTKTMPRRYRGYWCVNLRRILPLYCEKTGKLYSIKSGVVRDNEVDASALKRLKGELKLKRELRITAWHMNHEMGKLREAEILVATINAKVLELKKLYGEQQAELLSA